MTWITLGCRSFCPGKLAWHNFHFRNWTRPGMAFQLVDGTCNVIGLSFCWIGMSSKDSHYIVNYLLLKFSFESCDKNHVIEWRQSPNKLFVSCRPDVICRLKYDKYVIWDMIYRFRMWFTVNLIVNSSFW